MEGYYDDGSELCNPKLLLLLLLVVLAVVEEMMMVLCAKNFPGFQVQRS